MYLNTLRVPFARYEAIISHRGLHSSKITTIHQHLGHKRQNFKIQNPGSKFQNHPKSKSPAHIQIEKPKIQNEKQTNEGFAWNKLDTLKGNRLRLPKFASVGMVVNLPDLGYILLTLPDYKSLCCRSPSKTPFMYLNTLRVPFARYEAIISHRGLHSSKITTIHQHLGHKRQNFKIQNPGSKFQNHPKSKSPAHIQIEKPKIQNKKQTNEGFAWNKLDTLKGNRLRLPKFASVGMVVNLPDLGYILLTLCDYKSLCCRSPSKTLFMLLFALSSFKLLGIWMYCSNGGC